MSVGMIELHEKSKSYDWKFTSVSQEPKYKTKYVIPAKARDPFRMLVRDYMKSVAEKDERVYGFLDGALRMNLAQGIDARFNECLKLTLAGLTNAESQAVAACGGIISSMQNQEIRMGYQAQMLDEIRHTQIQMSLRNYYVKHAKDPAGWDIGQRALYQHPGGLVSVAEFQYFNTGDPIDCIVDLNVVTETAFTNILLVAIPQVGAANGDHALATTLLSVQSDEARHMANGYGSLMAVLSDERNVPGINRALDKHFWHAHKSLDALVGWQAEYGATHRPWAYRDQWQEWVVDDFIGSYIDRLSEFGVTPPRMLEQAAADVEWSHHTLGQVLSAIWPLNFWRSDAMREHDYDWFEKHYPGWTGHYGAYWDGYRQLADPAGGRIVLQELPGLPPLCQVCQLPCVMPRLDANEARVIDYQGKKMALCCAGCQSLFEQSPDAYAGRAQFWARYHGWDLAEVILDLGFVRPDGKTLMGQPTLDLERLWTIDDIRRLKYEVRDPLQA